MNDAENALTDGRANDDDAVSGRSIVEEDGERIGENGGSFRKRNAVLVEVGFSLSVVPLEIAFDYSRHDNGIMG